MGMDHTWILHTESFGRKTVSSNYSKGDAYWMDKTTCFNSKACFKPNWKKNNQENRLGDHNKRLTDPTSSV